MNLAELMLEWPTAVLWGLPSIIGDAATCVCSIRKRRWLQEFAGFGSGPVVVSCLFVLMLPHVGYPAAKGWTTFGPIILSCPLMIACHVLLVHVLPPRVHSYWLKKMRRPKDPFEIRVAELSKRLGKPAFESLGAPFTVHGIPLHLALEEVIQRLGPPLGRGMTRGATTTVSYNLREPDDGPTVSEEDPSVVFFAREPSLGLRIHERQVCYLEGRSLERGQEIMVKAGDTLDQVLERMGRCRGSFYLNEGVIVIPSHPPSFGPDHQDWRAIWYKFYYEREEPVAYLTWPEGQTSWRAPACSMTVAIFFEGNQVSGITLKDW